MYIKNITLPSLSIEEAVLYSSDSPIGTMKGLMKCHSGNGKGTIQLFEGDRLIDRIHAENIGCEYGEYDR